MWRLFANAGAPWYACMAAGVAVLLFASSLSADGHFSDARNMEIEQVLERQREALMRRPGAVGVGIGEHDGKLAIVFMVDRKTPETLADLPREIEGHPLVVQEVGKVIAY